MLLGVLVLIGSIVGGAFVSYVLDAGDVQAADGIGTYSLSSDGLRAYVLNTTNGEINFYRGTRLQKP